MSNEKSSFSFRMVMSRKLILLSFSSSVVNFMDGIKLWNTRILNTSCMLVVFLLYTIRMSSTYREYTSMWYFSRMKYITVFSMCCRYVSENVE